MAASRSQEQAEQGIAPLRMSLTSVPSTPFATSKPSAPYSPPARRLRGQRTVSPASRAHSRPAGRLHGQTAATAVSPVLPRSARRFRGRTGATAVSPALPRSNRRFRGQPGATAVSPAPPRSARRHRGQPGASAVSPKPSVLPPPRTVDDEPQIELMPHWSRPSQAIRRECPIQAAPATWLGHSHRINQPLNPHRSCIWWNRCPRYHGA